MVKTNIGKQSEYKERTKLQRRENDFDKKRRKRYYLNTAEMS